MERKELESLMARYTSGEYELFETLKSEYETLVKENPGDVELVNSYGYLYLSMGRQYLYQAEKIYEAALFKQTKESPFRIDGTLLQLRNTLGKNKDSIELYKKRVLEYPDEPDEYEYLALAYLNADQLLEAKKVIDALEKICTDDSGHTEIAGDVYARLGDTEKALEYWDKSVINQFSMGGWFSRAFTFKELGRLKEAADEWRKIIKMLTEFHDPHYLEWPKQELAKIEELINTSEQI